MIAGTGPNPKTSSTATPATPSTASTAVAPRAATGEADAAGERGAGDRRARSNLPNASATGTTTSAATPSQSGRVDPPHRAQRLGKRQPEHQLGAEAEARERDEHGHVPEVDRHRALADAGDQPRGIHPLHPGPDARARQLEQRQLGDAEHHEAHGRRVEVHEHVDGVRPDHREHGQEREGCRGHRPQRRAREPVDGAVGEVESELLHEQPHEHEVEQPDRVEPGGHAQHVDGDDSGDERERRQHARTFVETYHHRHECRGRQVHAEEPQRLADAVARRRHEVPREPCQREGDECGRDHDDQRDRGADEPFDARPHVVGAARSARTHRPPVVEAREPACDEEQRHDLHDPADRAEPLLAFERVAHDRPLGADAHAHHHGVQCEHGHEEHHADGVDARVACDPSAFDGG